ncbi:MAG: hypothetical protein ACJASV_003218 [Pseudorhodobacter sp.]|jgi:hypothetical protein
MDHQQEETLDPQDWEAHRAVAHRMVDDAIAHIAGCAKGQSGKKCRNRCATAI